jgi:hypothetical protein
MSTSPSSSDVVVLHPQRADPGAIVPQRDDKVALSDAADLTNVIPFRRPVDGPRAAPDVVLPADLARPAARRPRDLARLAAFVVLSLALQPRRHGARGRRVDTGRDRHVISARDRTARH